MADDFIKKFEEKINVFLTKNDEIFHLPMDSFSARKRESFSVKKNCFVGE